MSPTEPTAPNQLPLSVSLRDDATFANFFSAANVQAKQAIEVLCGHQAAAEVLNDLYIYLWGRHGSGCSHLLQAACHAVDEAGGQSIYLPLDELREQGSAVLEGMETMQLVCLDHLHAVVGNKEWEQALFHLFNRIRDFGGKLIIAADQTPTQLGIMLPDLSSRLSWGVVFQMQPLSDEAKMEALQLRAKGRGIELSAEVAQFVLNRSPRNMGQLFEVLDQLDQASLRAKRKVTIPFVKEIMDW